MNNFKHLIIGFLLLNIFPLTHINGRDRTELIYAFRNFRKPTYIRMLLVGEIRSKIKVAKPREIHSPYLGYDTRLDQVTVKVANRKGLKVGQKLYVIDKNPYHKKFRNGLIIGEITARAIFYHPFFGWVLTGTGILLRVREGMFIARTLDTENLERAFEQKKKGDFYFNRGNMERAISNYSAALEADRNLPEAHAALGLVYYQMAKRRRNELPIRALSEYKMAWQSRENFRYRYDKFQFYLNYIRTLNYTYNIRRFSASRKELLDNYLKQTIKIGKAALRMKGDSKDALLYICRAQYYLMRYYQDRGGKNYMHARDNAGKFLKQLLKKPASKAEIHRIAFLYYASLYFEIKSEKVTTEIKYKKIKNTINFSKNFYRWEDIKFRGRVRGLHHFKRLLLYHASKYYLYLDHAQNKRDPEVASLYRQLVKERQ